MENVQQMSLLEVALKLMEEKGTVVNIYDLIEEVLKAKGLDVKDNALAAKLYIDITTSSKFVYMGDENWDLKSRQSLDEFDKDGASFNPKDAFVDDDEDDNEEDNLSDEDEDDEDSDRSEEDEDEEEDEDSSDEDEEDQYDDDVEFDDDEDEDSYDDDSLDEDKYNKIMDDYEDLYEN